MNKDQIKGRVEEAKGQAKQTAGKVVGNKELEVKGRAQKAGGKLQAGYGDLKKDIKDST
ncbi:MULTISPECIES: CsbD family protein [Thioalkalivibrio]|uniref:CsbD family protein n=1 Tax=Thioalkalivibrio TaxID=106633 RepID=UPI00035FF5B8|nr:MULTISPECIES: CsbD family protein [Thioalkalivibrio]OOC51164.1 CsbD family protein [Thioalkalivibrio versutus]